MNFSQLSDRPRMILIMAIEQGNERAGISD